MRPPAADGSPQGASTRLTVAHICVGGMGTVDLATMRIPGDEQVNRLLSRPQRHPYVL